MAPASRGSGLTPVLEATDLVVVVVILLIIFFYWLIATAFRPAMRRKVVLGRERR